MNKPKSLKLAKEIAQLLASKKAINIIVIDVRKITTLTEFFVVASGTSETHLRTLYDILEIESKLKKNPLFHREGTRSSLWRVLDYGYVIVHLFHPDVRDFYQLERLWNEGKKVIWKTKKKTATETRKSEGKR